MKKIFEFFDDLINVLSDEFVWKNVYGEEMPCDYMNDEVPFNRVEEDRKKCINMVENCLITFVDISEKELVLAIYCNFYIKYGMAGRFQKEKKEEEFDGLKNIFDSLSPKDMYLQEIYKIVKTQDYNAWKNILNINKKSIVAKMYIFVKLCFEYCQEAKNSDAKIVNVDKYEKLWETYEQIPDMWKSYLIGEGELYKENKENSNLLLDENLLPHMYFISIKEILMKYIPEYYFSVLDKLGVDRNVEPIDAYKEVLEKLGVYSVENFIIKGMNTKVPVQNCFLELIKLINDKRKKFDSINWDMTFLVEKIHNLQLEEKDWVESKKLLEKYSFSKMPKGWRISYLHLSVWVPIKKSLFLSQYNEYLTNRVVKRNTKKKKEMMDYYAHSWKHISYPQIVKEVAEELGDSNRIIANRLMKAYNSERTLQRGIQLLQYISSDDEGKVSKEFKNGIAKSGITSENCISLQKVICDSLDLVIFKLLMVESDDSRSIEKCRERWKLKRSLDDLREEYTEIFLNGVAGNEKIIEWVNGNLIVINISIGNEWDSVRFKDDSFAVNQFKEILVEIFTNMFLHGEKSMTLEFFSTDDEMIIYETNECNDSISGSKSGISTLGKVLEYINYGTNIKSLDTKLEEKFEITIRINKKILIRKGR